MKAMRILVASLTIFALTAVLVACNSHSGEDQKLESEGNSRLHQADVALQDLLKYGINLSPVENDTPVATVAKDFAWSDLSTQDRQDVVSELKAHINNVNRIVTISQQPNMKVTGNFRKYQDSATNARLFLDWEKAYETSLTATN